MWGRGVSEVQHFHSDDMIFCEKCERPGVIRVTGMTWAGPIHTWYCCEPQCMHQREREAAAP